jgi:SAM-dependent methyltransferase
MTSNVNDWTTSRGEKWRASLTGMEAMLAAVDEPLIRALQLDDVPSRIADIGCGGGGTTLQIGCRAPHGSIVHGFDLSPALIQMACSRGWSEDETNIEFHVADIAIAAPPKQHYDRLVSRFGVMFFEDPPYAFGNLARWLAPGGRFAFAVWGPPASNLWISVVREVVSEVVDLARSDPEDPGLFRYAHVGKLVALLEEAGFGDLTVQDWHQRLPIGGGMPAAEAADFALASFSTFGELLAAAGGLALQSARQALTRRFESHQQEGVVRMDAAVYFVTGARPSATVRALSKHSY